METIGVRMKNDDVLGSPLRFFEAIMTLSREQFKMMFSSPKKIESKGNFSDLSASNVHALFTTTGRMT